MRFYNWSDYHKQLIYISDAFSDSKASESIFSGSGKWWKVIAGDLFLLWDIYILCLWDEIWPELDQSEYIYNISNIKVEYICNLISSKTMQIVHWMVRYYFTSYRNVLALYVPDIYIWLKYKPTKTPKIKKWVEQCLSVYGDIWSIENIFLESSVDMNISKVIKSTLTHVQQAKLFWDVKLWVLQNVICTHGNIWQDWLNLQNIYIYDERKRYYKSQQDPRYQTPVVVDKMREVYCNV